MFPSFFFLLISVSSPLSLLSQISASCHKNAKPAPSLGDTQAGAPRLPPPPALQHPVSQRSGRAPRLSFPVLVVTGVPTGPSAEGGNSTEETREGRGAVSRALGREGRGGSPRRRRRRARLCHDGVLGSPEETLPARPPEAPSRLGQGVQAKVAASWWVWDWELGAGGHRGQSVPSGGSGCQGATLSLLFLATGRPWTGPPPPGTLGSQDAPPGPSCHSQPSSWNPAPLPSGSGGARAACPRPRAALSCPGWQGACAQASPRCPSWPGVPQVPLRQPRHGPSPAGPLGRLLGASAAGGGRSGCSGGGRGPGPRPGRGGRSHGHKVCGWLSRPGAARPSPCPHTLQHPPL